MNILFVLYNDFSSNSAGHVRPLANELVRLGHDCCVAVPENRESIVSCGTVLFRTIDYEQGLQGAFGYENGQGPGLIHAWTPRERVRKFCEQIRRRWASRLFVHMEDNEWHLVTCALGRPFEQLRLLERDELDRQVPESLAHPHRAVEFLQEADGVTVIIASLTNILPPIKAILELWPSADEELFDSRPALPFDRESLRISKNSTVITYTGNVHSANGHEVRSLYLAVAILNREGFPATLVRTGRDYVPFLGPDERWARQHSVELGMIARERLPELLAMADVLVQPGKSDPFNDYRFPSKLPEFFSAGRPVILPAANVGRHVAHGRHGYVLTNCNGVAIANAVQEIVSDAALYEKLSLGALEFFRAYFSWSQSANKLHRFYQESQRSALAQHCAA